MKKIRFELQIYCTTGFDDEEDIALLNVGTFTQMLDATRIIEHANLNRHSSKYKKEDKEELADLKELMETRSGENIAMLGEIIGIQCIYEDSKGVEVKMTLSDDSGVSGTAKVNTEEHENEYKKLLGEAKKLASGIMNLN